MRATIDLKSTIITLFALVIFCPIISLVFLSFGDSEGLWAHLLDSVLIRYIINTFILLVGVSLLSLVFGVVTAWVIAFYEFRYSKILEIIILLPIACPAYLVAYAYTDFFEYAGPVQGALREFMGWERAQDYYFPEIRSIGGAIFVLASVLYPYVYLLSRTAFRQLPASFHEIALISNRNRFWSISFPLARPAIVAGLALVCMEVVSDFGTVEFFSIETLTLGIFNVWIGMNNITAAAQIACCSFVFILLLLFVELTARGKKRFNDTSRGQAIINQTPIKGKRAILAIFLCMVPVMFGFIIPISVLGANVFKFISLKVFIVNWEVLLNSVFVSLLGAFVVTISSVIAANAAKLSSNRTVFVAANLSATGYAFPGTMLAIGVIAFLGAIDSLFTNMNFYLSGTIFALVFAYLVRFQAIGFGSISSGLTKIPPNLISCSRSLGKTSNQTLQLITIPLIKRSIAVGGILTFVDIMKELPMTLLLRPFDFETLATYTYQFAHSELMEEASIPALIIIFVGLVPVIFLNNLFQKDCH